MPTSSASATRVAVIRRPESHCAPALCDQRIGGDHAGARNARLTEVARDRVRGVAAVKATVQAVALLARRRRAALSAALDIRLSCGCRAAGRVACCLRAHALSAHCRIVGMACTCSSPTALADEPEVDAALAPAPRIGDRGVGGADVLCAPLGVRVDLQLVLGHARSGCPGARSATPVPRGVAVADLDVDVRLGQQRRRRALDARPARTVARRPAARGRRCRPR